MKKIEKPEHYFNKALKNMKINEGKKRKYIKKYEILIGFEEANRLADTTLLDFEPDFGDWMNLIKNDLLFKVLISLTKKEQLLLKMWAIDGYTQKDIAILLDISEQAVQARVRRVKKKVIFSYQK